MGSLQNDVKRYKMGKALRAEQQRSAHQAREDRSLGSASAADLAAVSAGLRAAGHEPSTFTMAEKEKIIQRAKASMVRTAGGTDLFDRIKHHAMYAARTGNVGNDDQPRDANGRWV